MNIFILHWKQRKAARWHVDKHVVKMLLETCQLLYTVHWVIFYPFLQDCKSPIALSKAQKILDVPEYMWSAPVRKSGETGYRPCHVSHPCQKWARMCLGNYLWLAKLGIELAKEFRFRFKKEHSCEKHIDWLYDNFPNMKMWPRRGFPIAMDNAYKISNDPIVCYRNYYREGKKDLIKYTGREMPHWLDHSGH